MNRINPDRIPLPNTNRVVNQDVTQCPGDNCELAVISGAERKLLEGERTSVQHLTVGTSDNQYSLSEQTCPGSTIQVDDFKDSSNNAVVLPHSIEQSDSFSTNVLPSVLKENIDYGFNKNENNIFHRTCDKNILPKTSAFSAPKSQNVETYSSGQCQGENTHCLHSHRASYFNTTFRNYSEPYAQIRNGHSCKSIKKRDKFQMRRVDDALSVISEESLASIATRNNSPMLELNQSDAQDITFRNNRKSPANSLQRLESPWVLSADLANSNSSKRPTVTFKTHASQNQLRKNTLYDENRTRIRFRSESQDELEGIERNSRSDKNISIGSRRYETEIDNRERERNDIDLLSRPSWCDAKFALSRILQGKANGNKRALQLRSFLQLKLFWIGCFIQRNASTVLFLGILALAASAIGLKFAHMENNIEKLWVESDGKLEEELEYTKKAFATSGTPDGSSFSSGGYADSSTKGGSGYSYQMLIQTGPNTLSIESLKLHLKAAIAATQVTVAMYNQTWDFSDICYKEQLPLLVETESIGNTFSDKLFPCVIISPLDCFWDGAKLLGPNPPIPIPVGLVTQSITWTNLNPLGLLDNFPVNKYKGFSKELTYIRDVMVRAGITSGYVDRWCLNPYDAECPQTAPNFESKELPNLEQLFTAGCSGFATKFMRWPIDLIVGGVQRDEHGNVTRAQGLQTLFSLMGVNNMYEFHKGIKTGPDWSHSRAEAILQNWERQFAAKIYDLAAQENANSNTTDNLYAFTVTTTSDILSEFSKISYARLIGGCLLMMGYACLSLMRSRASRSQGAVGIFGVLLVVLSVAGGLGICSFIGISFNAASTQVLPFLLLGLGVDDMFLMAHHFGEISLLNHIPFEERTGECLKRVGVSVFLTSIAILSGFLFSLIIPMPALRAFGLQATIVTAYNLISVLVIYPAILSIDLIRRKNNKLDIIFCFDSSTANEIVDLQANSHTIGYDQNPAAYSHHILAPNAPPANDDIHLPGQIYAEPGEATITMEQTIQAFGNDSFVVVKQPTEATLSGGATATYISRNRSAHPHGDIPKTPPPQYSLSPPGLNIGTRACGIPQRNRVAFVNDAMSEPSTTGYSTPITGGGSGRTSRRGFGSGPPTNLTTPMESVRGSTHSLVAIRGRRRGSGCWRKFSYTCFATLPKLTLSQLGERYYAPNLLRKPVRIGVIVAFVILLGVSIYGATIVRDGLDFGDVLPRGTREHSAVVAQTTYFSFQNMYIVTKAFDYASNQENLQNLHDSMGQLENHVMRNTDGTLNKFWLEYFREWLQDLQNEFDQAWNKNEVNSSTWTPSASDKAVLAFKLLVQTGKADDPTDTGRIGCRITTRPCEKIDIVRLVSEEGNIPEDAFYNYLSAWVGNDPLTYSASEAQIRPAPKAWYHDRPQNNMIIPRSPAIYFAQMPFYLNNMRETEDYVSVINWVRDLLDDFAKTTPVQAYPNGYPFLFWQQYITLRFWLFISLICVISAVFIVLSLVLFNPWAAGIMALHLAMIAVELFGFMGLAGVKLSAVPAVILVASIGLGVEFTVHITFAYITACGKKRERVCTSIGHMLGPVVDGTISTLLGVLMLVVAEFDFVITYFFQVLAALLCLGILNGLILLPVILSFIGPPSEVIPVGGGSRLKTPTPPPSPQLDYHYQCCNHYDLPRRHLNSTEHYCYQRRQTFYPHAYPPMQFSSREDSSNCHCHHRCHSHRQSYRRSQNSFNNFHSHEHRTSPRHPQCHGHSSRRYARCQTNFGSFCHLHPGPTSNDTGSEEMPRVLFYPKCIVSYSANGSPGVVSAKNLNETSNSTVSQDDNVSRQPTNNYPLSTVTSSVTVKVRGRTPVVEVHDSPSTSQYYQYPSIYVNNENGQATDQVSNITKENLDKSTLKEDKDKEIRESDS